MGKTNQTTPNPNDESNRLTKAEASEKIDELRHKSGRIDEGQGSSK